MAEVTRLPKVISFIVIVSEVDAVNGSAVALAET